MAERRPPEVVHLHTESYHVRITRPGLWGNPYVIGLHGDRKKVVKLFELLMERRLRAEPQLWIARLAALTNKRLGCVCRVKPCHGDVLVKFWKKYIGKGA